jgi:quercetin dioxygenase-like cupin family protein
MSEPAAIVRKALLTAVVEGERSIDRIEIKSITLAPSQRSGMHKHPCTVVGYVADGAISFQIEGRTPTLLKEGDAFHEPFDARIVHFDNASDTAPATFVAFYLLASGEERLIEMLE